MESKSFYKVKDKTVFIVENPVECMDFNHLQGHVVMINKKEYMVIAVERFAHMPPWRAEEAIGLVVYDELGER